MPTLTADQIETMLLYGGFGPHFGHFQTRNHTMNQAQPMSDSSDLPNLGILIKLLKMTTSSNDGEALNAIRMANHALSKFGGDWERLLRGKVTVIGADPFDKIPDPPRAAPKPQPAYRAPPPPPTHTSTSQCSLIENYLDILEFVTLSPATQAQINQIQTAYNTSKKSSPYGYGIIPLPDFGFLESVAKPFTPKPKRGRRP